MSDNTPEKWNTIATIGVSISIASILASAMLSFNDKEYMAFLVFAFVAIGQTITACFMASNNNKEE